VTDRSFARDTAFTWPAALREAGLVLLAALVLTAASWGLRTDRLPLRADPAIYDVDLAAPTVSVDRAIELYDLGDHLFIDTRPAGSDGLEIPGAIRVREATFDDDLLAAFDFLTPDAPLVLFGDGSLLQVSSVAARLQQRGYEDIVIMTAGPEAWRQAGGEVREAAP
jgi:rhodanese-related sulfurtransferase